MLNSIEHEIKTAPIKYKNAEIRTFHAFKLSDNVFIIQINVKMPTIVGFNIYEHSKFHAKLRYI